MSTSWLLNFFISIIAKLVREWGIFNVFAGKRWKSNTSGFESQLVCCWLFFFCLWFCEFWVSIPRKKKTLFFKFVKVVTFLDVVSNLLEECQYNFPFSEKILSWDKLCFTVIAVPLEFFYTKRILTTQWPKADCVNTFLLHWLHT